MLREKDYLAPLDPNLMQTYEKNNYEVGYESADDVWALGITSLCFLFNEDFNSFYDWSKIRIRKEKIEACIQILYNVNFSSMLLKVISEMLDTNNYTRITLARLNELLNQNVY